MHLVKITGGNRNIFMGKCLETNSRIMKYAISALFILLVCLAKGQSLKSQKINDEDAKKGIEKKYTWQEAHADGGVQLILFKNHRFKFIVSNLIGAKYGEGPWTIDKDVLILNTDIKKNDVPIEVVCNNDTAGNINNFAISIPRDLKGNELVDCMVRVNNDSTTCLPSYGRCDGSYASIDSIKAVFDNGMTSKWISVPKGNGTQIHITVRIDFSILSYNILDNKKYKIYKDSLVPLDG
jgi:hypothetical protein